MTRSNNQRRQYGGHPIGFWGGPQVLPPPLDSEKRKELPKICSKGQTAVTTPMAPTASAGAAGDPMGSARPADSRGAAEGRSFCIGQGTRQASYR